MNTFYFYTIYLSTAGIAWATTSQIGVYLAIIVQEYSLPFHPCIHSIYGLSLCGDEAVIIINVDADPRSVALPIVIESFDWIQRQGHLVILI